MVNYFVLRHDYGYTLLIKECRSSYFELDIDNISALSQLRIKSGNGSPSGKGE